MKSTLLFLFLIIAELVNAQTILHKMEPAGKAGRVSASSDLMTKRIKEAAVKYKPHAPVARFAPFDFAFAANIKEFQDLNGFGILYVSSMNQDTNEYPIKRVYLKVNGKDIELVKLSEIRVPVVDSLTKAVFGKNRRDCYYFIPYAYTQTSCVLLIDWKVNRKEFVLCQFPQNIKLPYKTGDNIQPDPKKQIKPEALGTFLEREFQLRASKK